MNIDYDNEAMRKARSNHAMLSASFWSEDAVNARVKRFRGMTVVDKVINTWRCICLAVPGFKEKMFPSLNKFDLARYTGDLSKVQCMDFSLCKICFPKK